MPTPQRAYLVESYIPGIYAHHAHLLLDGLDTADERVRLLYALAIPEEETLTCVVTSPGNDDLVAIFGRAGLTLDHVAEVYVLPPP